MTIHIFPAPPSIRGDAQALKFDEACRYRTAALRARRLYPNCLGELVHRELTAYAEFGYRFAGDSLMSRLTAEILGLDGHGLTGVGPPRLCDCGDQGGDGRGRRQGTSAC